MTSKRIWYISKNVSPPSGLSAGGRGFELMRELAAEKVAVRSRSTSS
jgi:hypothetical protein